MVLFDYRGGIEEVYSNAHFPAVKISGISRELYRRHRFVKLLSTNSTVHHRASLLQNIYPGEHMEQPQKHA